MLQVLSFANHPRVWKKIEDPAGLVAKVVKETSEPPQQIERLYLSSVSRPPLEPELAACLEYLKQSDTPEKGLQGILWGLINTKEFILQH